MKAPHIQETGNPTGHGEAGEWTKWVVDQNWEKYTAEDHETWNILFNRQLEIMPGRACQEVFEGMEALGIDDREIPSFETLSEKLKALTGWEVVAVEGLIPSLPFFKLLADRKFPAGNFIRTREKLDYIQEPDVFHDVFGHVPLLANPVMADYLQAFGEGGLRAEKYDAVDFLSSLYWFTVEFGLIETDEGLRIYGAGILSSPGETVFSLEDPSPNRIRFDLERIMRTTYRVDDYQQNYFVIPSFEDLLEKTLHTDFGPIYERMKKDPTSYGFSEIIDSDDLITRGTQAYAQSKAAKAS